MRKISFMVLALALLFCTPTVYADTGPPGFTDVLQHTIFEDNSTNGLLEPTGLEPVNGAAFALDNPPHPVGLDGVENLSEVFEHNPVVFHDPAKDGPELLVTYIDTVKPLTHLDNGNHRHTQGDCALPAFS